MACDSFNGTAHVFTTQARRHLAVPENAMLVGQSLFQSVLTRLDEEENENKAEAAPAFRIAGLNAGFAAGTADAPSTIAGADPYLDFTTDAEDAAAEPEPGPESESGSEQEPIPTGHFLRLSEQEIAEELALSADDSAAALAEKRRQFARLNHPDRAPAAFREEAGIRMKTANLLIDRALRDLYRRSS